jgi:hypothetical protein
MATATIELRSTSRSDEERRRKTRRNLRLLMVLAASVGLAFWSAEETAIPSTPPLVSNETRHDFRDQKVGEAATAQLTLQNPRAEPFDMQGDGKLAAGSFAVDAWACKHLEPNASCTATVTFTPTRMAAYSWSFRLTGENGAASAPIVLMGRGMPSVAAISPCSTQQFAGGDTADTRTLEMGKSSGTFQFSYQTYDIADQMIVTYEGKTLLDTGCVARSESVDLRYAGASTQVTVQVKPNCSGASNHTEWTFTVGCPR